MHDTPVEWHPTVARASGKGAGPPSKDILGGYWVKEEAHVTGAKFNH